MTDENICILLLSNRSIRLQAKAQTEDSRGLLRDFRHRHRADYGAPWAAITLGEIYHWTCHAFSWTSQNKDFDTADYSTIEGKFFASPGHSRTWLESPVVKKRVIECVNETNVDQHLPTNVVAC